MPSLFRISDVLTESHSVICVALRGVETVSENLEAILYLFLE